MLYRSGRQIWVPVTVGNLMPRQQRIVVPDIPHHITHRGNNKQDIFFSEDDYLYYLNLLQRQSTRCKVDILGYCLMTNHVHLIIVPGSTGAMSDMIGKTHGNYTIYLNKKLEQSGHLWENRYYSCPLDDCYLITAMRYVERNPVRAGIVDDPVEYMYSSATCHLEEDDRFGLLKSEYFGNVLRKNGLKWEEFVRQPENPRDVEHIRKHTTSGKILGIVDQR